MSDTEFPFLSRVERCTFCSPVAQCGEFKRELHQKGNCSTRPLNIEYEMVFTALGTVMDVFGGAFFTSEQF